MSTPFNASWTPEEIETHVKSCTVCSDEIVRTMGASALDDIKGALAKIGIGETHNSETCPECRSYTSTLAMLALLAGGR